MALAYASSSLYPGDTPILMGVRSSISYPIFPNYPSNVSAPTHRILLFEKGARKSVTFPPNLSALKFLVFLAPILLEKCDNIGELDLRNGSLDVNSDIFFQKKYIYNYNYIFFFWEKKHHVRRNFWSRTTPSLIIIIVIR